MTFRADLHIHSHFSRATSNKSDLENYYISAAVKGVNLLGSGDFTHPEWFQNLQEKLEEKESGFYGLKKDISNPLKLFVPESCQNQKIRFLISTEISCIYKKDGAVRKNHNLVFMPDLETADRFRKRLDKKYNLKSDGRPILGIDAKHLLEIMLETSDKALFIPAHIWTPWFSLFGSKSGFNSLDECFDDLSCYIHALETGLSSDPDMNSGVSKLDSRSLLSFSDAHSPDKVGREATVFRGDFSYHGIFTAITSPKHKQHISTIEYYPELGKYYFDGHRKCGIVHNPVSCKTGDNLCSVCKKPLTEGVLNRILTLSDRKARSSSTQNFRKIIPLKEILSHTLSKGIKTKKVSTEYQKIIQKLGPELDILLNVEISDIRELTGRSGLAGCINKMRCGKVKIKPGFDGEFGKLQD